jgi:DNA ligase-associated metallophosphoesterase
MLQIDLKGEEVQLLPQKALWWPAQNTLVVADVHWAKTGHFRKHGIAVPASATVRDGQRLAALIAMTGAGRLIFAGDLFHSRHNKEVDDFGHWRASHSDLQIDLVLGNHDILPAAAYDQWNLTVYREQLVLEPFCIAHDHLDSAQFVLHGHIHPGIRLYGTGRQSLALSCFAQDSKRMILPAFGDFTGCYFLEQSSFRHLYAVGEKEVIQIK